MKDTSFAVPNSYRPAGEFFCVSAVWDPEAAWKLQKKSALDTFAFHQGARVRKQIEKTTVRLTDLRSYAEIVIDEHADGAEGSGREPDDNLHLHDERIRDGAIGARRMPHLAELHDGQHEPVQRRGAERHGEPGAVLRPGHPRGAVPSGVHPQHGGTDAEQHHGVHGEGREPLEHEQEREAGREGELWR